MERRESPTQFPSIIKKSQQALRILVLSGCQKGFPVAALQFSLFAHICATPLMHCPAEDVIRPAVSRE